MQYDLSMTQKQTNFDFRLVTLFKIKLYLNLDVWLTKKNSIVLNSTVRNNRKTLHHHLSSKKKNKWVSIMAFILSFRLY